MARHVSISQGYQAIVSNQDYDRVIACGPWYVTKDKHTFYASRNIHIGCNQFEAQSMHRFILGLRRGDLCIVHHRDGNGLNNQRDNLTKTNNGGNMSARAKRAGFSSLYKGVNKHPNGRWRATIQVDSKKLHLGYFTNEIEAAKAYDKAAVRLLPLAILNFPDATLA